MAPAAEGLDGLLCRLTGELAELHDGKITHYAVDQLWNWCSSKLRGHRRVGVPVKLVDTAYSTLNLESPGRGMNVSGQWDRDGY